MHPPSMSLERHGLVIVRYCDMKCMDISWTSLLGYDMNTSDSVISRWSRFSGHISTSHTLLLALFVPTHSTAVPEWKKFSRCNCTVFWQPVSVERVFGYNVQKGPLHWRDTSRRLSTLWLCNCVSLHRLPSFRGLQPWDIWRLVIRLPVNNRFPSATNFLSDLVSATFLFFFIFGFCNFLI